MEGGNAGRRLATLLHHLAASPCSATEDPRIPQLRAAREDFKKLIDELNCGPILIRLAWHDSGTFDQRIKSWPECGGANGAIMYDPEINMGANAGLTKARGYVQKIAAKYDKVSTADLIQLASATAVECMGGPKIDMKYGRVAVPGPEGCVGSASREGFAGNAGLPDAMAPFGCGAKDAAEHLRNVFSKKMGFNDREIVALSGAHTVGRAFKERSGTCPFGYGDDKASKWTKKDSLARADGKTGVGMPGGSPWTKNWLKFDNAYFADYKAAMSDDNRLWFPTDEATHTDPSFKQFFESYAKDEKVFFKDYALAHKKLSELGARFEPASGLKL
eukprot:TRINITY_DN63845_c0_g1_i1.p1 TRINITY_DN63845_c0_g1~~TRINITY_DN63845_c0_g1_i1.p1  ORF type:complete len:332 (+),score=85.53 TRINITY_DN63845_c0_g1_i1:64-1059(+)